jgi:hypothetical protein
MATQSVPACPFDMEEAHMAIGKARGVVEVVSDALMHKLDYHTATRITDALWAASEQLDKLAMMTGLDKPGGEA